jgi:phosphoheptose isomerase
MPFRVIDLSKIKTYPLPKRFNRVEIQNLFLPGKAVPQYENVELIEVAKRILTARRKGGQVIALIGGHVIKRGLSPLIIDLMKRGIITHIASNGAATIHDFEIALQGQTSEDVAKSIEDGKFGMAEETGSLINRAIKAGARDGFGIGESLGQMILNNDQFQYREFSIMCTAYELGIPFTAHIAIGTDIIHQHPEVDFSAIGWGSGQDFKIFTTSVSQLEGGVFCNIGSAVIGPEVFLKALSIVRNLKYTVRKFTTVNFDLIPLDNYREPVNDNVPDYYYRPKKNIIIRPVSLGGRGYHIQGDFILTIPNLHKLITDNLLKDEKIPFVNPLTKTPHIDDNNLIKSFSNEFPDVAETIDRMIHNSPQLRPCSLQLIRTFRTLSMAYLVGGTLFLGGNGGSMADALHISGELLKSFTQPRAIPKAHQSRLKNMIGNNELAKNLQQGLRTIVLGINPSLVSAINNDIHFPDIGIAQELYVLARPGDVFLGISTSGNAKNILMASYIAKLKNLPTILLTGPNGGDIAQIADIVLQVPGDNTAEIQENHIILYHTLCQMLETFFYKS